MVQWRGVHAAVPTPFGEDETLDLDDLRELAVDVPDAVNLAGGGLVAVAVLSTPAFDAAEVDPATIAVGDVAVAREQDGNLAATKLVTFRNRGKPGAS